MKSIVSRLRSSLRNETRRASRRSIDLPQWSISRRRRRTAVTESDGISTAGVNPATIAVSAKSTLIGQSDHARRPGRRPNDTTSRSATSISSPAPFRPGAKTRAVPKTPGDERRDCSRPKPWPEYGFGPLRAFRLDRTGRIPETFWGVCRWPNARLGPATFRWASKKPQLTVVGHPR